MTEEEKRRLEWLLLNFESSEGVTGIGRHMKRPDVFTEEEWGWLCDTSDNIMAEGSEAYTRAMHTRPRPA